MSNVSDHIVRTIHSMRSSRSVCEHSIRLILVVVIAIAAHTRSATAQGHGDAWGLLLDIQTEYERISDYSVDISATTNIPGMTVPPMKVKLYFKKPGKVHVESDRFAMLPRDVVMFHPSMFSQAEYDAVPQGTLVIRNIPCHKIKLLAKSDTSRLQRAMLFIDPVSKTILRMEADPVQAASATADFTYSRIDGHNMPQTIRIEMQSPATRRSTGAQRRQEGQDAAGKAVIALVYSNYRINKGISDDIFEKNSRKQ